MRFDQRFFEEGDKVKVTLRFRGREMAHMESAWSCFKRVKRDIDTSGKIEQEPTTRGRQ